MNITGIYRNQWVGVGGAPVTQTFSIDSPLGRSGSKGIGLSVIHDEIGPTDETYIDLSFAYILNTSENSQLAFGLKAGGQFLNIDFNSLNRYTGTDILLDTNVDKQFSPNVGAGVYFRTEKYYLGVSVPNLLRTNHFDPSSQGSTASSFVAAERLNFYMISGYVFKLSDDFELKPATLVKLVSGAPLQLDISANFRYKEKFTLGAAYRFSAALSVLAGIQVSENINLGFAYDMETTRLGITEFNGGSYEMFLRFELFNNRRVLYPRFF